MRHIPRSLATAAAASALIAIVVATTGVQAATTPPAKSVTLKVKPVQGTVPKATRRFCHKRKAVRIFRAGAMLKYKGIVKPAPAKHFSVSIRVEHCRGGRFHTVANYTFQGKRAIGAYKAIFAAPPVIGRRRNGHRRTTYFTARAIVAGVRSPRRYFAVTG